MRRNTFPMLIGMLLVLGSGVSQAQENKIIHAGE